MRPRDLEPDDGVDVLATAVLLALNNLLCATIGALAARMLL